VGEEFFLRCMHLIKVHQLLEIERGTYRKDGMPEEEDGGNTHNRPNWVDEGPP